TACVHSSPHCALTHTAKRGRGATTAAAPSTTARTSRHMTRFLAHGRRPRQSSEGTETPRAVDLGGDGAYERRRHVPPARAPPRGPPRRRRHGYRLAGERPGFAARLQGLVRFAHGAYLHAAFASEARDLPQDDPHRLPEARHGRVQPLGSELVR